MKWRLHDGLDTSTSSLVASLKSDEAESQALHATAIDRRSGAMPQAGGPRWLMLGTARAAIAVLFPQLLGSCEICN